MAKKKISNRTVKEIDTVLKSSFSAIKKDMSSLKETNQQQAVKIAEIKQNLKESKTDLVTVDKFNILKIKIGELNENMKKLWDLDKKLEDVDSKGLATADFEQQASIWENEFEKIKQDVLEIKNTTTTEDQTKNLIEDINNEFDKIKSKLDELRNIKEAITREELDNRTNTLNQRADSVRTDMNKTKKQVKEELKIIKNQLKENLNETEKELKTKLDTFQAEELVDDLNKEFDITKNELDELKKDSKEFALITNLKENKDELNNNIISAFAKSDEKTEVITEELNEFKNSVSNQVKELMTQKSAKKLISDLNTEFNDTKKEIDKNFTEIKKIHTDMKQFTNKKEVEKNFNELVDAIEDLDKSLSKDLKKVNDSLNNNINKQITKNKTETKKIEQNLSSDIKNTNERIKEQLSALDNKLKNSSSLISSRLKKKFEQLDNKVNKSNKETDNNLSEVFDELNKELNNISKEVSIQTKELSNDINRLSKNTKKSIKQCVTKKSLEKEFDTVREEFENVYAELDNMKNNMLNASEMKGFNKKLKKYLNSTKKEFVPKKHFNKIIDRVSRISEQVEMITEYLKDRKTIRTNNKKAAKKIKESKKKQIKVKDLKVTKKASVKEPTENYKTSSFLSTFLIVAAFVLLIISIGSLLGNYTQISTTLSVAAVICFVIGMVMRIVVTVKRSGN